MHSITLISKIIYHQEYINDSIKRGDNSKQNSCTSRIQDRLNYNLQMKTEMTMRKFWHYFYSKTFLIPQTFNIFLLWLPLNIWKSMLKILKCQQPRFQVHLWYGTKPNVMIFQCKFNLGWKLKHKNAIQYLRLRDRRTYKYLINCLTVESESK